MSKIEQWYNTAYKLQQSGNLEDAEALYRRILERQPKHLHALYLLGSLCAQQGRYTDALPLLERAVAIDPAFTEALNNRGVALAGLERWDEALASYAEAIKTRPGYADALNNQGIIFQNLDRLPEAIDSFERAIRYKPGYAQALNNLGIALKTVERIDEADTAFRQALAAQPDYPEAVNNVGLIHLKNSQFEEALGYFDRAIALQSEFAQAHNNRGAALKELGRFDDAEASYKRAIALKRDYIEPYNNLGTCLASRGNFDEAYAWFDKALAISPEHANAHWNRALALLMAGNYEEGWPEYEWRFLSKSVTSHASTKPRWDGAPLNGRRILVCAEQGFGDTLNFLRYLPLVKQRGGYVLFECQPALKSLLANYPAIDLLLDPPAKGEDQAEPYDVQVSLLSLPGLFGTTVDTVPAYDPPLKTPREFTDLWRARLTEINSAIQSRIKVGIVWAGNPTHKNDHNRSCSLADFAPLAKVPGVVFYSLQKGPPASQASNAPAGMTLIDIGPAIADFADTAAIVEHLDLVIAVDTSVVHLAAALGKPVWMLTPHCPDWRWLMEREDSPWYDTLRIFRQAEPRNWTPVMERIAAELVSFAAQTSRTCADGDLIALGEQYYASGDSVKAMECFEQALAVEANNPRALNNIAVLAHQAGGDDAAITLLNRVLDAEPNYVDALANIALCCAAKGDNAAAATWYQKALRESPLDTALWNALGHICLRLSEPAAAREVFAQSLSLNSDQPAIRAMLGEPSVSEPLAPAPAETGPDRFLRTFQRTDLEKYCSACYQAGEALAQSAYVQRDSAALYANGVANADSRMSKIDEEWSQIAARLPDLSALSQSGYETVSRLPTFKSQLLPALERICAIAAERHLLRGYLDGRSRVDAQGISDLAGRAQNSLVSIVVACYNYAHFLPETIASVIDQTYQNWELILVNDGSTDNTLEVAESLIAAHPDRQIRLITQQNKRLAGARNTGIRAAQGQYILPLDADDLIEPTMLAKCVGILDCAPHLSMVYTDQTHFDEQGNTWAAHSLDWNYAEELSYNQVCVCCLFRRAMWEEVGGYREDCVGAEDWDFWIKCGERGHLGWRIPEQLFRYRKHGASLSVTDAPRHDYLKADLILHHPHLYAESRVRWARGAKAGYEWLHPSQNWQPAPAKSLVSVIVPTFNRPGMLVKAIESILAQTYQNFEIIVVNDAGTDVTDALAPYKADGRITLINKPANKGLADSRNVGIAKARGKYISYLDDDDLYYPDHLETLVTFLENSEYKVAYADASRAHQRKEPDGTYKVWHRDQPYSFDFDYDIILTGNFSPVQCFMHEKACFETVGMFDTTLSSHEDWDQWLRLSRRFDCVHLKKITSEFSWRQDGSSMTSKQQRDFARTTALIYQKNRAFVQDNPRLLAHYDAFLEKWEREEGERTLASPKLEMTAPSANITPTAKAAQGATVDIVMVVHNQLDYTRRAIESIYRHTKNFHLLLWDNGSDAPTRAYLEEIGRRENVTLERSEENLGFIIPNNRLAALGQAPYLALLNSDTEVQPRWETTLMEFLTRRPEYGAVGYEGGLLGANAIGCGRGAGDSIDYVSGWCVCMARRTYEEHGLFDEQNLQFAYGEDSDFSLRLQEAGLRVHALSPQLVTHFGNKTIAEVAQTRDTRTSFSANHEYLRRRWASYLAQQRILTRLEGNDGGAPDIRLAA